MLILNLALVWILLSISVALAGAAFMRQGRGPELSRNPTSGAETSAQRTLAA